MKILMLSWEYPPRVVGGISKVVYDLSHELYRQGHDVSVITYQEGNTKEFECDKGVKVHRVANYMINPMNFIDWIMQLNFNMITKANELISSDEKFDVVHAHDWLVAYSAKTLKDSYKMPLVSTIHATESGRNGGIHDEIQRYINDTEWLLTYESTEVIVNSNYMKREVQRLFSLPFDKINVVPNGVDLNRFKGVNRDYDFRRQYAMDNEKIIFFVGRLVPEKGVQHLISSMPKILERYNDSKLVIAGTGPMLDELRGLANYLSVGQKVFFTGYLEPKLVTKMYKAADVSVFPSTYEPFGIVALEAMLSETPVVVSDIGGLDEIIEHAKDGLKSYAGNCNSIADSILEILFNQKLATDVVKNAKAKIKEKYNWTHIASQTVFTYEKAVFQTYAQEKANKKEQAEATAKKNVKQPKKETAEVTELLNFKKRQRYA